MALPPPSDGFSWKYEVPASGPVTHFHVFSVSISFVPSHPSPEIRWYTKLFSAEEVIVARYPVEPYAVRPSAAVFAALQVKLPEMY